MINYRLLHKRASPRTKEADSPNMIGGISRGPRNLIYFLSWDNESSRKTFRTWSLLPHRDVISQESHPESNDVGNQGNNLPTTRVKPFRVAAMIVLLSASRSKVARTVSMNPRMYRCLVLLGIRFLTFGYYYGWKRQQKSRVPRGLHVIGMMCSYFPGVAVSWQEDELYVNGSPESNAG